LINQVVCSDSKKFFHTSKTLSLTSVGLKQSGADWTEVFNEMINKLNNLCHERSMLRRSQPTASQSATRGEKIAKENKLELLQKK
jgi:hypothetical protein